MELLDNINNVEDLRKLSLKEKNLLANELRDYTLEIVSKTGGHLASNLGVVELTIAIHSIFDTPKDRIIWDVGHQTYIHKMLTGRKDKMQKLRQLNGLAGFPKMEESEFDCFETGHSSTSISAALGMARARDIKNEKYSVVAVIGDGALTGGMALEALNDAGSSNTNLIVILNDNTMSISKNVGGISRFLTKLRTRRLYNNSNKYVKKLVRKLPNDNGEKIIKLVRRIKDVIKQLAIPNMLFENLGFKYLGPVDGHNIEKLEELLIKAKEHEGPVLIHVLTKKGKGYEPAEKNPDKYHATSSFNIENGQPKSKKTKGYSKVFGETVVEIAKENDKVVGITAAMKDGTGFTEFAKMFPNRFFDCGIAEQHALTMAAGMARNGLKPIVSIYSSFYQRGYDQVIHDIAMQKLPVVMCVDRAGIVGNDGETHQGIYDLAFFNIVPNLIIMAPKDFEELRKMLKYAISLNSPVVIRYPRGGENTNVKFEKNKNIELGKAEIIESGKDISIIAIGKMVAKAKEVATLLKEKNIATEIINVRFFKPFDEKIVLDSIKKTKNVISMEDGITEGGLASKVSRLIQENKLSEIKFKKYGYPDEFVRHGKVEELEKVYGLNENDIAKDIIKNIKLNKKENNKIAKIKNKSEKNKNKNKNKKLIK